MNFEKLSKNEILTIATPMMDNLMTASSQIDHQTHTRDFTERLKNIVSQDYFQTTCEYYQREKGFFTERELIAIFRRPDSAAIIWKQHYSKAKGEFVAEMVLVHQQGHYRVDQATVF